MRNCRQDLHPLLQIVDNTLAHSIEGPRCMGNLAWAGFANRWPRLVWIKRIGGSGEVGQWPGRLSDRVKGTQKE